MGRYRAIQRTGKRRPSCPSHCSLRGSSNQAGNHWRHLGEKVWLMLNTSLGSSQRTGQTEGGSFDVIHTNNGGGLDGQVTGRWRAAYQFSLLEIKRKWLCDWLGHKAWGKGSYLSEGTHHLQWCGMQEENRLSSEGETFHFWSVTLKMPTDSPRDRSACLLDQEKWCITEAWDLFLYRWYLKSRKPSMGSGMKFHHSVSPLNNPSTLLGMCCSFCLKYPSATSSYSCLLSTRRSVQGHLPWEAFHEHPS